MYGSAKDIRWSISDSEIKFANEWELISETVYKRDSIYVVTERYPRFTSLLSMKREPTWTFKNFEFKVMAQASMFNHSSSSCKLLEAFIAFTLLSNLLENSLSSNLCPYCIIQWVVFQLRCCKWWIPSFNIILKKIASVLWQCDSTKTYKIEELNFLSGSSAYASDKDRYKSGNRVQKNRKRKLTTYELSHLQSKR